MMSEGIDWDSPEVQDWIDEQARKAEAGEEEVWPFGNGGGFDPEKGHPKVSFVSMSSADCLMGMSEFPDECVDSVVTDPPYGMSIDGKKWDGEIPGPKIWREVHRLLKPGGIVIAASHARTYHRLGTILELAGFEIIDMIDWRYSQAFPAGTNLGGAWQTHLRRAHEPWAVAQKAHAVHRVPGKRPGTTKQDKLTKTRNFQHYGTGGFRVVGNSQDGGKWASNAIHTEKALDERGLGLNPNVIRQGTQKVGKKGIPGGVKSQPNNHSTVKPLGLMRRLVSLVAKPGQVVMDPFAGSGTTGMACMAEGMNFIGFEMEGESFDIFQQRVEFAHGNREQIPPSS